MFDYWVAEFLRKAKNFLLCNCGPALVCPGSNIRASIFDSATGKKEFSERYGAHFPRSGARDPFQSCKFKTSATKLQTGCKNRRQFLRWPRREGGRLAQWWWWWRSTFTCRYRLDRGSEVELVKKGKNLRRCFPYGAPTSTDEQSSSSWIDSVTNCKRGRYRSRKDLRQP